MTTMGCRRDRESTRMDAKLKRCPMKRAGGLRQRRKVDSYRDALLVEVEDLHARVVRRENGGRCFVCGVTEPLPYEKVSPFMREQRRIECGHLFSRANQATRFDVGPGGNCHPQCHGCNQRHEVYPHVFVGAFIDRFGVDAYERVKTRMKAIKQWTIGELEEMRERFAGMLTANGRESTRMEGVEVSS